MEFGDESANYQIIEDKAYTEDGMLVYNVFVYHIPKRTTKEEFLQYFNKFGDIVSVRLLNDRNKISTRQSQKIGFVNFTDPVSAARTLQNPNHSLNKKRIWVKACDSWHQPGAQQSVAPADAENSPTMDAASEETYIMNLNDDCLDAIFKHLGTQDQINFARCCSRLREVFVMRAKVEYKILDLEDLEFLTLWQIRQFLQMAGPHIEKLGGRAPYNHFTRVIEFLGIFCTSVKSISILSERLTANNLRKLFKNMHMIEELQLHDADLKDDCIPILKKLKNLKSLSLEENFALTGHHIKDLTTLESLSLNECKSIMTRYFKKICENLKELKYLDIQMCPHLNVKSMNEIVNNLHKLETIKLSCDNGQVDCIACLQSLKHLYLYNEDPFGPVPTQIFVELAKHRADQMETLAVRSYNCLNQEKCASIGELRCLKELICPNNDKFDDMCLHHIAKLQELETLNIKNCKGFTASGLLNLIQKCRKLSTLNVSNCKQLNDEFATKLLELLKTERKQREQEKPLRIKAYCSGIPHFAVNSPTFESATDLLLISFDYEMDGIYTDNLVGSDSDIDYLYNHDDEDDYFMFFSEPDDDDNNYDDDEDLNFDVLRRYLYHRMHRYGDDVHDLQLL